MIRSLVWVEGLLYTVIGIGVPIGELFNSDRPLTHRVVIGVSISSFVGGCNALKAFFSTSFSRATGDAILMREEPREHHEHEHEEPRL